MSTFLFLLDIRRTKPPSRVGHRDSGSVKSSAGYRIELFVYRTTYLTRFLPPTPGVPRESIALKIAVASNTLSSSGVGHRTEAFDTVYPSIELFVYHI